MKNRDFLVGFYARKKKVNVKKKMKLHVVAFRNITLFEFQKITLPTHGVVVRHVAEIALSVL